MSATRWTVRSAEKNIGGPLNRATRVKGRATQNAERKPSLIKDKGISATSRLVVTTTSASHSPASASFERSSHPLPPHRPPRVRVFPLARRDPPRDNPRDPQRSDRREGGDYTPLCRPCLFTLRRVHSRLNRPFHHRRGAALPGSSFAPLFFFRTFFSAFIIIIFFFFLLNTLIVFKKLP